MNIYYIRSGDYFIPDLELPEEPRPTGKWGRMHREYLKERNPIQYNCLLLSDELWTYLADMNEQAQDRHLINGVSHIENDDAMWYILS